MKLYKSIEIDYKKGETILRPEDTPQGVYYLEKGFIRSYLVSDRGKEMTLNIFKTGTYFPLQWALNNFNNEYFYEAMTNVKISRIQKEDFSNYLINNPQILMNLSKKLVSQLEMLYIRMSHTMGDNAFKRTASTLLFMAKRYGEQGKKYIHISIPVTHLCIASIAGLTRETTSATLKKISNEGIISYKHKKIIIKDIKKLQRIS